MKEVINIFEQLKNTSSINEKKAIISKNKDNELFKECLVWLLDSNIQTGISNKKINKNVHISEYYIPNFSELMDYLKKHNTGTDDDISIAKTFINNRSDEYREFYEGMITKTYKLGADAKVVNSIIPGLIPTFDIMLGTPLEKVDLEDGTYISISHKMNGTRCVYINGHMKSRQNKLYTGLEHIIEDINKLGLTNMFVDGELVYKNKEGLSDSEAFQVGTGIAVSKDKDKSELKLVVFDIFPANEFVDLGTSVETYKNRKKALYDLQNSISRLGVENISVVEFMYEGYDHKNIWECLDKAEILGWEGCMVNLDTPYECKRTKNLIKVKKFFDITLRVIDIEEGTGRNKGRLGALVCKYYDNTVKVGSGFSDEDRIKIWNNKDEYIGKLADVKYKEITKDKKTNLESLQFPVFLGFRPIADKSIPDDEV